jgi:hypothetical protein
MKKVEPKDVDTLHRRLLEQVCRVSVGYPMGIIIASLLTSAAAMAQATGMRAEVFGAIVKQLLDNIVTKWDEPANDE